VDRRVIHHPIRRQVLAALACFWLVEQEAAVAAVVLVVVETTVKPVVQLVVSVQYPAAVAVAAAGLLL